MDEWEIINIEKTRGKDYMYDIEVKDNHNFFANGILSSNCHHYASKQSKIIFEHMNNKAVLGLSASPERDDKEHVIFESLIPIVYDYSVSDALKNEDICEFEIINIPVLGTTDELDNIKKHTLKINEEFKRYNYSLQSVFNEIKFGTFKEKRDAAILMRRINFRKRLLYNNKSKNMYCSELIELKHKDDKVIVFTELVDGARMIKLFVDRIGLENYIYFGGKKKVGKKTITIMKNKEKKENLEKFRVSKTSSLITVKALDEGLNVPDCNIGIIVSGSGVTRQFIQRLGRTLRKRGVKKAILYQLYIPGTKDEAWMKKRTSTLKEYLKQ